MNRKVLPLIAALLVLLAAVSTTPFSYAVTTATIGPKLVVTTIPEDDQIRKMGIMVLGLVDTVYDANPDAAASGIPGRLGGNGLPDLQCTNDPTKAIYDPVWNPVGVTDPTVALPLCAPQDLLSQHKLLVTFNGQTLVWRESGGDPTPIVTCNVLEKDKVNVVPDPKTNLGQQFKQENLMTKLVDVSDKFICKVRWKSPAPGLRESVGVLDVYYVGPFEAHWAADNILTVEASLTIGRSVIFGADIQDICVLAWSWWYFPFEFAGISVSGGLPVPKPTWWELKEQLHSASAAGTAQYLNAFLVGNHWVFPDALGPFTSCTDLTLVERQLAGVALEAGQDPMAPAVAPA